MAEKRLINLIGNIQKIALKDNWTKSYDKTLDYFCWTKPLLSKSIHLIKISREVLLYVNQKGTIEGIGVEYLKNNFIQHNPEYKSFTKLFTQKVNEAVFVVPKEKEKLATDQIEDIAKDLVSDIYKENLENNRTADDMEKLLKNAIEN